jgi:t-SNARE complex subunit (syntaxin)
MCSKAGEIEHIQKDIRTVSTRLGKIETRIYNGISSEVPKLRKAVEQLSHAFYEHVRAHERAMGEASGKRKNLWRILGTVAIAAVVMLFLCGLIIALFALGLLDADGFAVILREVRP